MLAAMFWTASATGRTVGLPWKHYNVAVPPDQFATNQAKYNARASYAAAIAAFAQLTLNLLQY
jgi:hypothetical protein